MSTMTQTSQNRRPTKRAAMYPRLPMPVAQTSIPETAGITWTPLPINYLGFRVGSSQVRNVAQWRCLICVDFMRIDPDEDGQSDDEEEMSVNTESGADTTDQDMTMESLSGSQPSPQQQAQPTQEPTPSSRSRASNLAAARGLGIRVASSDGSRHGQVSGLPASPRPPTRSPTSSPHPHEAVISGTSAHSQ